MLGVILFILTYITGIFVSLAILGIYVAYRDRGTIYLRDFLPEVEQTLIADTSDGPPLIIIAVFWPIGMSIVILIGSLVLFGTLALNFLSPRWEKVKDTKLFETKRAKAERILYDESKDD